MVRLNLLILLIEESGRLAMLLILQLLTIVQEVFMSASKPLPLIHQLLLLILHSETPVALLDLIADLIDARVESALFCRLGREFPRRQFNQTVLIMYEIVRKREHLVDNVVHRPHSFDLLSHLN